MTLKDKLAYIDGLKERGFTPAQIARMVSGDAQGEGAAASAVAEAPSGKAEKTSTKSGSNWGWGTGKQFGRLCFRKGSELVDTCRPSAEVASSLKSGGDFRIKTKGGVVWERKGDSLSRTFNGETLKGTFSTKK